MDNTRLKKIKELSRHRGIVAKNFLLENLKIYLNQQNRISKILTEHNLNIHVARISTEKGAAIDTFYVRTKSGKKLIDLNKISELKNALETEIA